jgi:hypothetical protein
MAIPTITAPYSLEALPTDVARQVVAGTTITAVAGKIKIFLGATVAVNDRQSINGSLKNCRDILLREMAKGTAAQLVVYGPALSASDNNIVVSALTTGVAAGDVAIVVDVAFPQTQTHAGDKSMHMLLDVLLENSKNN